MDAPLDRAQPDWAYDFPDRTGPDTQICQKGPAAQDWIRTYIFIHFTYQVRVINSHKIRSLDTNLVSKVNNNNNKILKKKFWKNFRIFFFWKFFEKKFHLFFQFFGFFFSNFKSVQSPASGKENVRFPNSLDFENLPDFRTGRDVR